MPDRSSPDSSRCLSREETFGTSEHLAVLGHSPGICSGSVTHPSANCGLPRSTLRSPLSPVIGRSGLSLRGWKIVPSTRAIGLRAWGLRACGLGLLLALGCLSGCVSSPWLAQRAAREISKESLVELADEGQGDHLLYLGSQGGYHYLRDSRSSYAAPFKVDDRALKLGQTFPLQSEEPYVVYPHVIAGRKLGQKPKALPGF
jgi:hypothetical protein